MNELEMAIKELETQWKRYHKEPRKHRMPNMEELAKLRIKRDRLRTKDRWNTD